MHMAGKKQAGRLTSRAAFLVIIAVVIVLLGSGAALAAPPWSDAPSAWWVSAYGVTDTQVGTIAAGYPDGTFRPAQAVTRAQFTKMAVDGLGVPKANPPTASFTDVPAAHYYYQWIEGGVAAGLISGFGDGTFGPSNTITRQQANSILGSYLAQKELTLRGHIAGDLGNYPSLGTWYSAEGAATLAGFADASLLAPVHAPATAYLVHRDVVNGAASGGSLYLGPGLNLNRAQAAVLILRVKAVLFPTALPTVTSLQPNSGPAAGGNTVVIAGTNFTAAPVVKFGTRTATSVVVESPTRLSVMAPSGTAGSTVDVTVTTPAGTSATSAASKYTYGVPTVTGVDPAAGPTLGGNSVVITGTNFIDVTAVKFGIKNASAFVVNSATQITAEAPAGTSGTTVDVTVIAAGGTSAPSAGSKYSYGAPVVTELDPPVGPPAGGNEVIITGKGFTDVTAVKFGGKDALDFEVDSPAQITAIAPSGVSSTTVDVRVTTAAGTSTANAASKYHYGIPVVTGIAPVSGPHTGGTTVVITGAGFIAVSAVQFGTVNATSFVVNSLTQITAKAPAGAGVVDVRVVNPAGTSAITEADEYTYVPVITSLSPNHGPAAGGNTVQINGQGLVDVTSVTFGGKTVTNFSANPAGTRITVTAPSGISKVDVRVNIGSVQSANTAADDYTYAPTITGLDPAAGSTAGGNTVTITGTGFTGATKVTFGGTAGSSLVVVSDTEITVKAPAHAAGTVEVRVQGKFDLSADAGTADNYIYGGPAITSVSPDEGPAAGGTVVTITGTGFTGVTQVTFGGAAGTGLSVNAAGTQITVTTPVHDPGLVDVVVTTPAGSATEEGAFEFL
jgi:hypothetical protein